MGVRRRNSSHIENKIMKLLEEPCFLVLFDIMHMEVILILLHRRNYEKRLKSKGENKQTP